MGETFLTTAFKDKEKVKALGAKWDPDQRKWYVPSGLDLAPFTTWLPAEVKQTALVASTSGVVADAPEAMSTDVAVPKNGTTLSQLLAGVAQAVAQAFKAGVWTMVEVVDARLRNGHVYIEVSERDSCGSFLAKANAVIWATIASRILPEFERVTGAKLAPGIKLLVRARPVFKVQYGFSLEIDAIDPEYTLGDLEAKKKEIRARLQREGLFDANRKVPASWDYCAVLVVAPQGGAGLGDFSKEADRLARFAVCRFTYVHSRFQGEGAAGEILEALMAGLTQFPVGQPPDAVILIRGGGAVNDLAWLNDYPLARFICECSVPVLTGIGHERDSTVLDEVAHTCYDTPSKVVAAIEQLVSQRAREARTAFDGIVSQGRRDIDQMQTSVERLDREVKVATSSTLADARAQCSQLMADLRLDSVRVVHRAASEMQELFGEVRNGAVAHVARAKHVVPAALNAVKAEAFSALRTAKVQLDATLPALLDRAALDVRRARADADAEFGNVIDRSRQTIRDASLGAQALTREITGQGPQKTLGRGFAIVRGTDGKTLTSAESAASAESIEVAFKDGKVNAAVRNVELGTPDERLGKLYGGGK